ncbi:MAG: gamma carbonic anhydrase family protein [Prevotella sp.]|nr:gamma carbonic anhydrase family protein [Prevotella sp.]
MALVKSYKGITPKWGRDCYFSENATIVGDVTLGDECSLWFNAVVRGDVARIIIGDRCNVQDGACLHVTNFGGDERPTEDFVNGHDCLLEDDVTVGHNATLHACHVRKGALIGMGATVLDKAVIGEGAVIAAGALVLGGTQVGDHEIWGGVPAKFIKKTRPNQAESFAQHYVDYSKIYLAEEQGGDAE